MIYENSRTPPSRYDGLAQVSVACVMVLIGLTIYVSSPAWTRPFSPYWIGASLIWAGMTLMICSYVMFDASTDFGSKLQRVIGYLAALSAIVEAGVVAHIVFSGRMDGLAAQMVECITRAMAHKLFCIEAT